MDWREVVGFLFGVVLAVFGVAAFRIRSTDPRVAHLWFGLSREENGRLGTIVGVVGAVVVWMIDREFFARHSVIAIVWGLLVILCAYRGWVREKKPGRRDDARR